MSFPWSDEVPSEPGWYPIRDGWLPHGEYTMGQVLPGHFVDVRGCVHTKKGCAALSLRFGPKMSEPGAKPYIKPLKESEYLDSLRQALANLGFFGEILEDYGKITLHVDTRAGILKFIMRREHRQTTTEFRYEEPQ